jgi:CDP-diacylglycerol--glycerol-3-phosphate 3-phosphatidyltransferase
MYANLITLSRIALIPFVLWVLFAEPDRGSAWRWLAVLLFVLSAATDGVDGAVARRRGEVTNLGKILDPIADKLLIGGALVSLSILGEVSWWITGVILVRELGITAYRFAVIRNRVIAASGGGKLKTVMQSIMIGFLLSPSNWMPLGVQPWVEGALIAIAVVLTVWTGIAYLVAGAKK